MALAITAVAILTKIAGGALGAGLAGSDKKESLQIGTGMVARSEVALIVTNKGVAAGIITAAMFAPIALMVIITSILTPVLLKLVFTTKKEKTKNPKEITDAKSR
jgi:Kef-type K+ transport system membrane component KefB